MALTRVDAYLIDLDSTGGITLDDQAGIPTFKVNSTTHRVGIGTATPVSLLEVAGVVTATTFVGALTGNVTGSASSVVNAATFNSGGAGAVSGTTFNGSATQVISYNTVGASPLAGSSSLTTTGTVTSGTWSGLFGAVSGANLTSLTAGNLSGTIPSAVLGNSSHFIGTTSIALNRASASQALEGILSVAMFGSTSGAIVLQPAAVAGLNTITLPASTGTVALTNNTLYVGTTAILLGRASATQALTGITSIDGSSASVANTLTFNNGGAGAASGTTFNGSAAQTISYNTLGASPLAGSSSLTTTGTVTSGTWSGSFGAVSGANLTGLTAGNLSGTIPSGVLGNSVHFIGTTSIALNRASAAQSLTGINIDGSSGSCTGNSLTATTLQTARTINGTEFNGSASIDTTEWFHSGRDFPNGTLITTNIDYSVSGGDPFVLEIRGNSYGNIIPLDLLYQGYIYADTIINHGGLANGLIITGLVAINVGGNLCFWFPTQGYWNGYNVKVYTAYATRATNRVTSITGTTKPTSTKEVSLSANIRQSLHSGNYNSYSPTLTGTGASGSWGISVTGSSASCTGNAATATNVAYSGLTGTVPTWNQNTTGSSASCTGNAATATTATNLSGGTVSATTGTFSTNLVVTGTATALDPSNITGFGAGQITESSTGFSAPGIVFGGSVGQHCAIVYGGNVMYFGSENGSDNTLNTRMTLSSTGNLAANGAVSGTNITSGGNVTGSSASCTGNAATATTATNQSGGTVSATTGSFSSTLTVGGAIVRSAAGVGYLSGNYSSSESPSTSGAIYSIGGSYVPTSSTLGNMYGIGYGYAGNGGIGNPGGVGSSTWGMYVASAGTARIFLDSDNGVSYATGSHRSPIFYDSGNTAYYTDPASTSNLNGLTVASTITGSVNGSASTAFGVGGDGGGLSGIGATSSWGSRPGGNAHLAINYHTGVTISGYPGYGGVRLYSGGYPTNASSVLRLEASSGVYTYGQFTNDSRVDAPIFYDSNDTGYYCDPNSITRLNVARFVGGGYTNTYSFTAAGTKGSGNYVWVRASMGGFNGGGDSVRFSVTRAITDDGNSPYGGCTADFVAHSREWHGGQETCTVFYTQHGQAPFGQYITNAGPRDLAGGGYWFYMRVLQGVTYKVYVHSESGAMGNFDPASQTDPGSVPAVFTGFNILGTGGNSADFVAQNDCIGLASVKAPIFYDSNDTAYYVDPNSNSRFLNLGLGGVTPDTRLSISGDSHFAGVLHLGGTAGTLNSWGSRDYTSASVRYFNASTYEFNNYGYGSTYTFILNASLAQHSASVRAPIFYDSNDTAYYLDPASTTTSVQVAGAIEQGNNYAHPNIEWSATGATGEVIFYLPGTTSNYGMVHMVFDIYEYNSPRLCTVIVGGHNWSSSWYNTGCNVVGFTDKSVRLGVKGSRFCVVFGNTGSSWSYGTIRLRKIHNGGFYNNIMDLGGNWSTELTTSESFTSISGDLRGLRTPSNFEADGTIYGYTDVRSPIFYDYNNTAYYTDPASTSNLNNVQVATFGVGTAASGTTGEIRATNNVTAYYSDERLKENIKPIPSALSKVLTLKGVTFNSNKLAEQYGYTDKKEQVGVIAQDVEKVLPQVVVPAPFDIAKDVDGNEYSKSGENYKTVHYDKLVPLLIEAIKELKAEIDDLKSRISV